MKSHLPRPADLLRESSAHKNRRRETRRQPAEKIVFCDQCGGPYVEEEVYSGICVDCARMQFGAY